MSETDLKSRSDEKLKRPPRYVVKFINDDFTPVDFVMTIMCRIFKMSEDEALAKTMEVHHKGSAVHGSYTHEVAETLVAQAMSAARSFEFPFRCSAEKG